MYTCIKNNCLAKIKSGTILLAPGVFLSLIMLLCNPLYAASNMNIQSVSYKIRLQILLADLQAQTSSEKFKVEAVNAFFNQVPYAHDSRVWGQKDYWATPDEFLQRRMGDCEDVAIAKYFTLRKLGVSDHKLRLAYGKIADFQSGLIQPHMVMIYKPDNSSSVVLDNLNMHLRKVSERQDLILEYTFNMESLWRWQENTPVLLGKANTLEPWRNLLKRL